MEETDPRGRTTRTTEARDSRQGIPQGSPLSPLLANLYMRRFVLGWKLGLEQSLGTRLVTYADDLVILCRRGSAEKALRHLCEIMGKLKLTVNAEKTLICKVPDGEFDFLGYFVWADVFGEAKGTPDAGNQAGGRRERFFFLVATPSPRGRNPQPASCWRTIDCTIRQPFHLPVGGTFTPKTCEERRNKKVSRLTPRALILRTNASPLGDARKS